MYCCDELSLESSEIRIFVIKIAGRWEKKCIKKDDSFPHLQCKDNHFLLYNTIFRFFLFHIL